MFTIALVFKLKTIFYIFLAVIPPITSRSPTTGWFQTDSTLTIAVYTRRPEISADDVITKVKCYSDEKQY